MADTKISALPASTTPLAGTEVLPIVQSGTTKQVSVDNLTAGRAISATQLTLTTGSVIVANGQGIDFSATPGTGTSELFDDYEEGTWTPIFDGFTTQPTITYAAATGGRYTKIGRMVYAYGAIRTTSVSGGSGALRLGGLPFTVAPSTGSTLDTRSGAVIGRANGFLTNNPISATALGNSTLVELWYRTTSNGAVVQSTVADLDTIANANLMIFTVIYEAA